MTRLQLAKQKLRRLQGQFETSTQNAYAHMRLTNGQPMNDKRNGRTFLTRQEQLENKVYNTLSEIRKQEERVKMLKLVELKKEKHLTSNYGVETSVYNIDKLKERKQNKATRDKVKLLEEIRDKAEKDTEIITKNAKYLIDNGLVKQWDKKPIYYFVVGLRKVAVVVDNKTGEFIISKKYFAKTDKDEQFVNNLLKTD